MMFDYGTRLTKLRAGLAEEGLGALVMAAVDDDGGSPNIRYLSGFGGTTGVLIVSATDVALAVDGRYTLRAAAEATGVRLINGGITEALETLGLPPSARIGFEDGRVSYHTAHEWMKEFPALTPTRHLVESLREVKDAEEITALRDACARTTEALVEILPSIAAGMREVDVAVMLDVAIRKHGAVKNSFTTIVASGENSASPHHETSEKKLEAGEPVVIDFGGLYPSGYCSDITRTIFVPGAEPDPEMVKVYRTVLGANRAARAALKPGMMWKDYDAVARSYVKARGYAEYFTHGLGHSVGLEVHDVYDYAQSAFKVGTIMTDEPGIYLPGKGGVRIEDMLALTQNGVEVLNPTPYLNYDLL